MRTLALLSLLLLPALALADAPCAFQAPQKADLDLAGVRAVVFDVRRHDLHLAGSDAVSGVELRGRACASSASLLDSVRVTSRRDGDRLVVKAESDRVAGSLSGNRYAWLDLQVRVPPGVAMEVDTGSGDASVDGVASLVANLGSGDLDVRGVKGALRLRIGSGDAVARNIGSLDVRALASGDVRVRDVHGDARVGNVGSGDFELEDVAGGVDIDNVGSGDVTLRGVKGGVTVGSIGSGGVDVDGVGGDFSVRTVGSGDVRHRNVAGKVNLPPGRH